MRVLITGAGGLIGKKLVSRIPESYEPTLLMRREKNHDVAARVVRGDLSDLASLKEAARGAETVIHLAGLTRTNDPVKYDKINVQGTKNLLLACRESGVKRFIFISSRAAGLNGGAYARSKYLAEEEVKKSGLDWVILRLAEVYGAGESEAISSLISLVKSSPIIPVIGDGGYKLSPIFVDDAVSGILAVLEKPEISGKIYNLSGPEEFSYNELVDRIARTIGVKRLKLHVPVALARAVIRLFSLLGFNFLVEDQVPRLLSYKSANICQAVRDFGFSPINFDSGLKKLLK